MGGAQQSIRFTAERRALNLNPEPDSHGRTVRRQSVRLPDRVAATFRGVEAKSGGLDALELPRDAGANGASPGRGTGL